MVLHGQEIMSEIILPMIQVLIYPPFLCTSYSHVNMTLLGCTQIQSKRDLTLFVGIAQVFLGTSAIDDAGNPLPKLIYVSREKEAWL